jgi:hypothetical protein
MGNKKTKSKAAANGRNSSNGRSASKNHVGADPLVRPVERSSTANGRSGKNDLRTYSIPDYRLDHTEFQIRQVAEKDRQGHENVRYEVT